MKSFDRESTRDIPVRFAQEEMPDEPGGGGLLTAAVLLLIIYFLTPRPVLYRSIIIWADQAFRMVAEWIR